MVTRRYIFTCLLKNFSNTSFSKTTIKVTVGPILRLVMNPPRAIKIILVFNNKVHLILTIAATKIIVVVTIIVVVVIIVDTIVVVVLVAINVVLEIIEMEMIKVVGRITVEVVVDDKMLIQNYTIHSLIVINK